LKLVELLVGHKVLLTLPLILGVLTGVVLVAGTAPPAFYISNASVWIDRPDVISGLAVTDFNPYVSPAQNQASVMHELLASRSFVSAVVKDLDDTENPSELQMQDIRQNTFVWPAGEHLLSVQFKSRDGLRAAQSVKAVLDQFTLKYTKELKTKAEQGSVFYQAQLGVARETLDTATIALQNYLRTHPQVAAALNSTTSTTATTDPEYAKLKIAQDSAKSTYDKILSSYSQSVIITNSSGGISSYFEVIDQPQVPVSPIVAGKKLMALKLGIGLALGSAISAAIFFWLWRTDHRVRTSNDLAFLGLEVIALNSIKAPRRRHWPREFVRLATALTGGFSHAAGRNRIVHPINEME